MNKLNIEKKHLKYRSKSQFKCGKEQDLIVNLSSTTDIKNKSFRKSSTMVHDRIPVDISAIESHLNASDSETS